MNDDEDRLAGMRGAFAEAKASDGCVGGANQNVRSPPAIVTQITERMTLGRPIFAIADTP
jgi:hypothetical protein